MFLLITSTKLAKHSVRYDLNLSFEDAVKEYERLLQYYPQYEYRIIELPKVSVKERAQFVLSFFSDNRNAKS